MAADPDAVDGAPRSGAQAVERAAGVLRCLAEAGEDVGVSVVAARTGLTVSTAHRLLRALRASGLVDQDERSERYHLGVMAAVLGRVASDRLGFALVEPELGRVAARTGETASLGTRADADVLVVVRVESAQPLRFDQRPGSRVPLHASAMGKALLAWSPDPAAAVASLPHLARLTARTIADRRRLEAELRRTRDRGWALNDEERDVGVRAIAAPVLDRDQLAVAAVAIQGPAARLTDDRLDEVAREATSTAAAVAALLPVGR